MRRTGPGAREYFSSDSRDSGEKGVMFLSVFLLLLIISFFTSTPAWAQAGKFIPIISYSHGELDLDFYDETFIDKTGSRPAQKRSETAFIEKITLTAYGFVYHPRFIIFRGGLTGGLMQGKFEFSNLEGTGSWHMSNALGYDFRMIVLPEHPYTLDVHSRRDAFVSRGTLLGNGTVPVSQVHGIAFQYKKRPFFAGLTYDRTKTETFQTVTDGNRYGAFLGHILGIISTNGSYVHSDASSSSPGFGSENSNDSYFLNNWIGYGRYRLRSRAELNKSRQTTSDNTFLNTDRFLLDEVLEVDLPWNVKSEFRFNHSKYDYESDRGTNSSTADNAGVRITHRLFKSLDTTYSFNYSKLNLETAESRSFSHQFYLFYSKKIPWGSMLAGVTLGLTKHERIGSTAVSQDVLRAAVLSDLVPNAANIDEILSVDVKDPATGFFFPMRASDYLVTKIGTMTMITVLSVPPQVAVADPSFVYEFQVSYSLLPEDVVLRERFVSYNLNMVLFNGMVSPYFSRSVSRQELVSGNLGGNPTDRTTDTMGVTLRRKPFTLRMEYHETTTDIDARRKILAELLFNQAISRTWTVFGKASYNNDEFESLTDRTRIVETGGALGFRKDFTSTRMSFSSSVSYSRRTGDVRGYSYSLDSNFNWNIRRTSLVLGANINHSENETFSNRNERDYEYFYLKATRRLF